MNWFGYGDSLFLPFVTKWKKDVNFSRNSLTNLTCLGPLNYGIVAGMHSVTHRLFFPLFFDAHKQNLSTGPQCADL